MNRPLVMWAGFVACVLTVVAALGYLSAMVVQGDRREAEAMRRAALEENVRLGLWRLDAALTPLLARENARPCEAYEAFHPVRGAVTQEMTPLGYGSVLRRSELHAGPPPMVRLHFQLDPATGQMTVPYGQSSPTPLEQLKSRITVPQIMAAAEPVNQPMLVAQDQGGARDAAAFTGASSPPEATAAPAPRVPPVLDQVQPQQDAQQRAAYQQLETRNTYVQQQAISEREFQQRARSQQLSNQMMKAARPATVTADEPAPAAGAAASQSAAAEASDTATLPPAQVIEGRMMPAWIEGELLLLRTVSIDGRELVQGVWLDWPAIEARLLAEIADVLPDARLHPAGAMTAGPETRMMASAPIVLTLGAAPGGALAISPPVRTTLVVAWLGMVLAIVAVTVLLRGAMVLSERRGAFVSAVTHELRTPLTTFRLYTQMLADGMVSDESKRGRYLRTLSTEAERLSHLVENVLTYARLERASNNGNGEHQRISAGDLIGRMSDRLAQRCDQAGMQLIVNVGPDADSAMLRTDVAAVERIVYNLVDNACKYARDAEDRRIELSAERVDGKAQIRVQDCGPGVAAYAAKRVFRPFSKSAVVAAHSAPGVGLGLALSRRLARSLGGDLRLDRPSCQGAAFTLTLPVV